MPRDKVITLFSKNHIAVYKTVYNTKQFVDPDKEQAIIETRTYTDDSKPYRKRTKWVEKRFESPLGFWYKKLVNKGKDGEYEIKTLRTLVVNFPDARYEVSYVISCNGVDIGTSLRPWEVMRDDKAMADHFITDLFSVMKDLFVEWKEKGLTTSEVIDKSRTRKINNIKELRDMVFEDLFGNVTGPRYQTDLEKIVSHGFDTKISFRKV